MISAPGIPEATAPVSAPGRRIVTIHRVHAKPSNWFTLLITRLAVGKLTQDLNTLVQAGKLIDVKIEEHATFFNLTTREYVARGESSIFGWTPPEPREAA